MFEEIYAAIPSILSVLEELEVTGYKTQILLEEYRLKKVYLLNGGVVKMLEEIKEKYQNWQARGSTKSQIFGDIFQSRPLTTLNNLIKYTNEKRIAFSSRPPY